MKAVAYHFEARLEAEDAAAYYHGSDPGAASRYLDILEMTVSEVQLAPQRWPFEQGTAAQRRQVKGFPYTVFYLNEADKIFVLAIAHTSRRPGYWKTRIAK